MMENKLRTVMSERGGAVEKRIDELLSERDDDFACLIDAVRYSALGPGKKVRAFLTTEFARLGGAALEDSLTYAAIIEMIHAASLIHDDLPCMDDDDMRRGRPSCHIAYGEDTALLAGDALMVYPYEIISKLDNKGDKEKLEAIRIISSASGMYGMIGGQQMDISGESRSVEKLTKLQGLKTGRMIRAAALLGCVASGNFEGSDLYKRAIEYADNIGLAFQIIDDLLDVTGDPEKLGKKVGMDEKNGYLTFAGLMSYEDAFDLAAMKTAQACAAIADIDGSEILVSLAKELLMRES
ncbi:MAG: polyprenyl synthetase family protein [Clostridia bacterium]|nr:polyprenyl synthetase family protein [Clostridia bacterium]MBQ8742780.1 polyprenyl synthetase family protein [Clostridia bacterium]MBQ9749083.1 polyprenyl synthetase family protein [Clostridia bacterium]